MTGLPRSYGLVRPCAPHGYARLVVVAPWTSPLASERQVPAVPHESPDQTRASSTPVAIRPVPRYPARGGPRTLTPMLTTDGSLPQQLGVVWSRLLEADSEGPSFISHAACARSVSSSRTFLSCACGAPSTAQWLRTITARLLAGRLSEVMKSRVSRSIVRPISRMLSTMTTPFKPGQSWRSCNQETS